MKYKIITLESAYNDLKDIKKYLAQFYPSTVKKFVALYKKQQANLKEFPQSYPIYAEDTDYHKLVCGDYLIFYMINDDIKTIEIHRILHGSRDIGRYLQ